MILGAMVDRMLQAAADDWIGVWELPWMASSVGGVSSPTEIRNLSLMVIRKALDEELLEVGDVTESGFRPWGLSPDQACSRIESEWRRFPNGPKLGDISCWFNLTERGRQHLATRN
jgi:hypothetical protein